MACLVSLTVKVGGVDHKLPENVHTFKKKKVEWFPSQWLITLLPYNHVLYSKSVINAHTVTNFRKNSPPAG